MSHYHIIYKKGLDIDLPKEKINSYNKIFQEKFGRDATEEEIVEIERDLTRLAEIMLECYLKDIKKKGI